MSMNLTHPINSPMKYLNKPPDFVPSIFEEEDEILVFVEEKVEEVPLGHQENPVNTAAKILVYASLV